MKREISAKHRKATEALGGDPEKITPWDLFAAAAIACLEATCWAAAETADRLVELRREREGE